MQWRIQVFFTFPETPSPTYDFCYLGVCLFYCYVENELSPSLIVTRMHAIMLKKNQEGDTPTGTDLHQRT